MTPEQANHIADWYENTDPQHWSPDEEYIAVLWREVVRLHHALGSAHYALTGAYPSRTEREWHLAQGARQIIRDALNPTEGDSDDR